MNLEERALKKFMVEEKQQWPGELGFDPAWKASRTWFGLATN
jgi:hypothetical protein